MAKVYDVVVIGAGPAGLTAANFLQKCNHSVFLIDEKPIRSNETKSVVLYSISLEILDYLGLSTNLLKKGIIPQKINIFTERKLTFSAEFESESAHPFITLVAQSHIEYELEWRLRRNNIEIQYSHKLIDLQEHEKKTIATIEYNNQIFKVESRFAIIADGARGRSYKQFIKKGERTASGYEVLAGDIVLKDYEFPNDINHHILNNGALSLFPLSKTKCDIYRLYLTSSAQGLKYLDSLEVKSLMSKSLNVDPDYLLYNLENLY